MENVQQKEVKIKIKESCFHTLTMYKRLSKVTKNKKVQ